jgi:hypothetical protein
VPDAPLQPGVDIVRVGNASDVIIWQFPESVTTWRMTVKREVYDKDVTKSLVANFFVISTKLALLILGIDFVLDDDGLVVVGHQNVDVAVLASHQDVSHLKPVNTNLSQEGFK